MKKTKIALIATTLAILSLMISAYHAEPQALPSPPHNRPVSEIIEMDKAYAPTIETPSLASGESQQISTHSENVSKPVSLQNVQPQPTEKEEPTITTTPTIQTATKPTTPTPKKPPTPKMGDTRIMNGQKQSYFVGFGWVDYMGENECIFEEGMYENGNKVGIMD
jgi:outer membrane biosynthesis protein TonB